MKNNTLADEIIDAVLELELQEILKPTIIGTYVYKHKVDGQDVQIPDENVFYRIWLNRVIDQLSFQILETALCQARVRLNSITLVPVNISAERAFEVAAENRLDWMNARSSLVDSWRKIQVAANALKSDLSIQVKGSAGTIDNDGLKFDASNSQISVGVVWDSPMTRHTEQSAYRTQLLMYQQSRRDYYSYVDNVQSEIRDTIRLLQRNQIEFEIQRASIAISTTTVELAQLELIRPPQTPGQSNSDNNLAQRIITALEKLLDAQNSFLDMWIGYESKRMGLDLQMGTLQLDDRGHWIDPGPITDDSVHVSKTGSGSVVGVGYTSENVSRNGVSSVRDIVPPAPTLAPEVDEADAPNGVPPRPDNGSKISTPVSEIPPLGMQVIEVQVEDTTKPKQTKDAPLPPVCDNATIAAEPQTPEETELKPSYHKKKTVFNNGKTNVTFIQSNINTTPLTKENAPQPPEGQ
ncbi:MAG: TolC family protein [Planctomycetaceae bacterium]|nr:TolC family protein [Planctomycetaceae bacterium]